MEFPGHLPRSLGASEFGEGVQRGWEEMVLELASRSLTPAVILGFSFSLAGLGVDPELVDHIPLPT